MSSASTSAAIVRTLDKVIRREFRLAEGDAFNTRPAAPLAAAPAQSRLLRDGGRHDRAGQRAGQGRDQDQGGRDARPASSRSAPASRPRTACWATSGSRERNLLGRGQDLQRQPHRVAAAPGDRHQLHRALFPRPRSRGRLRPVPTRGPTSRTSRPIDETSTGGTLRARLSADREPAPRACATRCATTRSTTSTTTRRCSSRTRRATRTTSLVGQTFTYDRRDAALPADERLLSQARPGPGRPGRRQPLHPA